MVEARPGIIRALPAIASGILLLLATPGGSSFPLLAWLGLVPLLWSLQGTQPKQAFLLGFLFGGVFYVGLIYWIVIVLGRYGYLPFWVSVPALLLLAAYMSIYPALFAAGLTWAGRTFSPLWLAPVLWVALDFIRGWLFSGFPWLDLGYTQFRNTIILQNADLFGHHGITFLIILTNGLLLSFLTRWTKKSASPSMAGTVAAMLLLLAAGIYGTLRLEQINGKLSQAETLATTVVQGNIPQDRKWSATFQEHTMREYLRLTNETAEDAVVRLVIWPETALPFYPFESSFLKTITNTLARNPGVHFLTGAPHRIPAGSPPEWRYYNSAFLLSPDQPGPGRKADLLLTGRYDKQHLVPFGEYLPLRSILPLPGPLVETIGDFSQGSVQPPLPCGPARLGVLICFESIFPELARRKTAAGATLLINITNDAWFGRSSAPHQHLAMAAFRAVENRRSLARAANTGISGFIDPAGRTEKLSPLFAPYAATSRLTLLHEQTVFTRFGHYFPLTCLLFVVVAGLFVLRGRQKNNNTY
jgi:apolipoprotein N-acyltransferase